MKRYQNGGKTPVSKGKFSGNKLEKKTGEKSVTMIGNTVTKRPAPLGPLKPGKTGPPSKLPNMIGTNKLQKLLRGGSKRMC